MGEEEPEASFLGCKCTDFTTCSAFQVQDILLQHPAYHRRPHLTKEDCNCELPEWIVDPKTIVEGKAYEMEDFVDSCVDTFCELAKVPKSSLKKAVTPFIDDPKDPKDWEIQLGKDCERTDESPNRNRAFGQPGEEIMQRHKQLWEAKSALNESSSREAIPGGDPKLPKRECRKACVRRRKRRLPKRVQRRLCTLGLRLHRDAPASSHHLH